jgi:hypothetical protein
MKSLCLWAIFVALFVGATVADLRAEETTTQSVSYAFARAADGSEWATTDWGRLGVARMATAPFPDDSRTTGFVSKRGVFPREGHYDDNRVAFVIPRGFQPHRSIDIIVHFHGHLNECVRVVREFKLGELLEASGRNALVIVPQGPKNAPDSGGGKLEKPGAFSAFVKEALDVLARNEVITTGTRVRHIVLSGHSGAYRVMAQILDHGGELDKIREVWLFDAAYGFFDELAAPFTSAKLERQLRSIFTDHLATENIQIMSRIALAGHKPMIVFDDLLTTAGTSADSIKNRKFRSVTAKAGSDEIVTLLQREPLLFIYTSLSHNDVIAARRYFEFFARESPFLQPRK